MRCRHGGEGEFAESQSTASISGVEPAGGVLTEQRTVCKSIVSGKWRSNIYLFLLAAKSVSGTETSAGGSLCGSTGRTSSLPDISWSHGSKRHPDSNL